MITNNWQIKKRKLTRKEARTKYTKDANINEKSKRWSRKGINRYNDLTKVGRLGRMIQASKEMEIELKIYVGVCGKSGVRNSLEDGGDSNDSDSEDLELYDGFVGKLTVINVERTAAA